MSRLAPILCLLAASCAHHAGGAPGEATPHVPGIRIIKASQAAGLRVGPAPFELRFGDKQDGTKLVLDFLEEAKRSGARYVSDIRIELRTERGGRPVPCATRLLPFSRKEKEVVPYEVPVHLEQRSVMKPVTTTVTEYTYQCRMNMVPVTRMETTYQYRYDYYSKSSRSVPVTRMVTSYESRQECHMAPVTRTVTRYEYQLESRYVPPSLTHVAAQYTDFDLVESAPTCDAVGQGVASALATTRLPHRIVGTVYRERP